jgi:ABC-type glycerol-3-phosphate transport system substrate-binding protein
MPRKSAGLLVAALVAAAGCLAACGSSSGGGTSSSAPNVLKVWWYEGPGSAYQIAPTACGLPS